MYECLWVCTCVCVIGRVCVVDPVGDALKWAILIQNSAMSLRDPFLQIQLWSRERTIYNLMSLPLSLHRVDPLPHDTPKPPGYTRFVCISDTHSRTDTIQMPYGDVLLHAGDFTELGLPSEVKKFNDWLGERFFLFSSLRSFCQRLKLRSDHKLYTIHLWDHCISKKCHRAKSAYFLKHFLHWFFRFKYDKTY